ncbi:MAG: SDR family oxidoreductase [Gemmatimonadaceae bacterium]|nr:SDR family oxidoreductase [Gemmatimonadaceae bacterium]
MTTRPTAVITGASKGIGAALASRCVREGMRVALIARTPAPLQALAGSLGELAHAFPCDLTDADAVRELAVGMDRALGAAPDVLVNNAGLFRLSPVEAMAPADFSAVLQTNLVAPFLLTRAVLPAMRARGTGTIVTLGSIADRRVFRTNAALRGQQVRPARVARGRCAWSCAAAACAATLVSPGPVNTPLWDLVNPDERPGFTPRAAMLSPEDVADAIWYAMSRPATVNIDELRLSRS